MDRVAVGTGLSVVPGLVLIVGAPPDPQIDVHVDSVDLPEDAEDESAVVFTDLSAEHRTLFEAALDGDVTTGEEPDFDARYVTYEGGDLRGDCLCPRGERVQSGRGAAGRSVRPARLSRRGVPLSLPAPGPTRCVNTLEFVASPR